MAEGIVTGDNVAMQSPVGLLYAMVICAVLGVAANMMSGEARTD
jgi:hypothetical protein